MRREVWLQPNRRGLVPLLSIPLLLLLAGAVSPLWIDGALGWVLAVINGSLAGVLTIAVLMSVGAPRLIYADGYLLVNLGPGRSRSVPIDDVECFFLGTAAAHAAPARHGDPPQTSTVVVRLAEAAADWKQRPVSPWLGRWCDGYITIYGSWCEPLSAPKVERMNRQLVAAHRSRRAASEQPTEAR